MHILNSQDQLFKELAQVLVYGEVNLCDRRSVADLAHQYELTSLSTFIHLYGDRYFQLLRSFRRWYEVQAKKRRERYLKPNRGYTF